MSVCPAASAVLSESVSVHFTGPSRSGHVKVGSDTWAWANVWAEAKRRVRGLLQFRELDKLLVLIDLAETRDWRLEMGNEEVVDDHPIFLATVKRQGVS